MDDDQDFRDVVPLILDPAMPRDALELASEYA